MSLPGGDRVRKLVLHAQFRQERGMLRWHVRISDVCAGVHSGHRPPASNWTGRDRLPRGL